MFFLWWGSIGNNNLSTSQTLGKSSSTPHPPQTPSVETYREVIFIVARFALPTCSLYAEAVACQFQVLALCWVGNYNHDWKANYQGSSWIKLLILLSLYLIRVFFFFFFVSFICWLARSNEILILGSFSLPVYAVYINRCIGIVGHHIKRLVNHGFTSWAQMITWN